MSVRGDIDESLPEDLMRWILEGLPAPYGAFLILQAAGVPDDEISRRLGVPPESLPAMAMVARSKMRRLLASAQRGGGR